MDTLLHNLRYTVRTLLKSPGFAAVAVVTLALGIGANTTIFSLVNAVLLRPPAHVSAPERLIALYTSDFSGPAYGSSSYPDYEEFRKQTDVFAGVLAYTPRTIGYGQGDDIQRIGVELVSDNYFDVLGAHPAQGRTFGADERAEGGAPVVVVSHQFWVRRLGADPSAVGRPITLNGNPVAVVGVAPEGFSGRLRGLAIDLWIPITTGRALGIGAGDLTHRGARSYFVLARLAPGVEMRAAEARTAVLARHLLAEYPDQWRDVKEQGRRISLLPESQARIPPQIRGPVLAFVALLLVTVGLVLLICCANVASLMLARATGRSREIGVRLSLGASRGRIVGQLLTESVVLAAVAAVVALLLAFWLVDLVSGFVPELPIPVDIDLTPDARVLAFTGLVALGTGILFGLAPALKASRVDLVSILKAEAPTLEAGHRRFSLQSALVVGQIAVSLLLLIAALLFVRTLQRASATDPGFDASNMVLATAEPRPAPGDDRGTARVGLTLQERLGALPGVRAVSWASSVPLGFEISRRGTSVEGYQPARGEDMEFAFNIVGPRYFETLRVPLVRGRDFAEADRPGAPGVIVVNEAFAKHFWPGQDPLSKRVSVSGSQGDMLQVVGVARDGKYQSLAEAPRPYLYLPALQHDGWGVVLHVRTTGDPAAAIPLVRQEVETAVPAWRVANARTMDEHVGNSLMPQRVAGGMLGLFGMLALLLASVGLYGLVAYAVARRTKEIGLRVALGAQSKDVVALVLRQSFTLVAIGLAIGLPLAWAVTRLLGSFLLGQSTTDPLTFIGGAALLTLVTLVASLVPARRAARVDPMVALRSE